MSVRDIEVTWRHIATTFGMYAEDPVHVNPRRIREHLETKFGENWQEIYNNRLDKLIDGLSYHSAKEVRIEGWSKWLHGAIAIVLTALGGVMAALQVDITDEQWFAGTGFLTFISLITAAATTVELRKNSRKKCRLHALILMAEIPGPIQAEKVKEMLREEENNFEDGAFIRQILQWKHWIPATIYAPFTIVFAIRVLLG